MHSSSPESEGTSMRAARFQRLEKESLDRQNLLRMLKRHGKVLERVSIDEQYGKPDKVCAAQRFYHDATCFGS